MLKFFRISYDSGIAITCYLTAFLFSGCVAPEKMVKYNSVDSLQTSLLVKLLRNSPEEFQKIVNHPDSYRLQIIYTAIDRKKNNKPVFTHHFFHLSPDLYFYPASTVKLPITLLSLEKLRDLEKFGVNRKSAMISEAGYWRQTAVYNDPSAPDGKPSIEHYIKKILLVSNNDASNRLYEFLGQDYLNKKLHQKGYRHSEIGHRLSVTMSQDENRHTNPVKFYADSARQLYYQEGKYSSFEFEDRKQLLGEGFVKDGKLIAEPFDFSEKNRIALNELHTMLQTVLFPTSVKRKHRFKITGDDRKFLLQYMSQYPSETRYPQYDSTLWDAISKFLLWGAGKEKLPNDIRVFNKIGGAYGFLTDVAYVADFEKNIEFMLSATIYCNSDQVFNDDKYDYDTIGYPFLKYLGQVIYAYELNRSRKYPPDLTEFKMRYEK